MAVDDDKGQPVLFVAEYNHVIHFPNTYGEVCYFFPMFNCFLLSQVIMQRLQAISRLNCCINLDQFCFMVLVVQKMACFCFKKQ